MSADVLLILAVLAGRQHFEEFLNLVAPTTGSFKTFESDKII